MKYIGNLSTGHPDVNGNPLFIDRAGGNELPSVAFSKWWTTFDKDINPAIYKNSTVEDAEATGSVTIKEQKTRALSSAAQSGEIERGKITEGQISRWLEWIDVAELSPNAWLGMGNGSSPPF